MTLDIDDISATNFFIRLENLDVGVEASGPCRIPTDSTMSPFTCVIGPPWSGYLDDEATGDSYRWSMDQEYWVYWEGEESWNPEFQFLFEVETYEASTRHLVAGGPARLRVTLESDDAVWSQVARPSYARSKRRGACHVADFASVTMHPSL